MIGADRRGMMAAFEIAWTYSTMPSQDFVIALARLKWFEMKAKGEAHIDPQSEFIQGFVDGFNGNVGRKGNGYVNN